MELSVDQALAAGAETVQFNQPILLYVETFLNLPVEIGVPMGFYDRQLGVWVPSDDERIIQIIAIVVKERRSSILTVAVKLQVKKRLNAMPGLAALQLMNWRSAVKKLRGSIEPPSQPSLAKGEGAPILLSSR